MPRPARPAVERLEARTVPAVNFSAAGSDPGVPAVARLLDADTGAVRFAVSPFGAAFTGGVRVAVGDVTGDTIPDLITAAGPGGGPVVRAFDGVTGAAVAGPLASLGVFDPEFRGGLYVAAADVNYDGVADVVVGAGEGGGPQVAVIDGATGTALATFFAFDPGFRGGVRVAAGDVDGDGRADVVAAAGPGGGPQVKAFALYPNSAPVELLSFYAYAPEFGGGVFVAAADVSGDLVAEIITGAGAGGGPQVSVFDSTGQARGAFFAADAAARDGVLVGARFVGDEGGCRIGTAAGTVAGEFDGETFAAVTPAAGTGGMAVGTSAAPQNAAQTWAELAVLALRQTATPPTRAARALGVVGAAMFDAANSITGDYQPYRIAVPAAAGASADAAVSAAARDALVYLFPTLAARFDTILAAQLAVLPDAAARDAGAAVGRAVAADLIAFRKTDGAGTAVPYTVGSNPGDYQLTPPRFARPLDPNWPAVAPFAMTSGSQFRPGAPPALTSAEYAADFNEVQAVGSTTSTTRTAEQTRIAHFWSDTPGPSPSPPGHWFDIALQQTRTNNLSLADTARALGLVGIALADASIVSWDAKYVYDLWRPITAIRAAGTDGNPATAADAGWTSLLGTPPFPAYTSGHSTFSGAAATVLESLFGANTTFRTNSVDVPGAVRTYASFQAAADEAGKSRIYGGIHFEFDNRAGLSSGRALGGYVVATVLKPR